MAFSLKLFLNIRSKELLAFSRQLAVMVSASVPIVESLFTIAAQINNHTLKEVITHIAQDVSGGLRLSLALSKFPQLFNSFFVHVIKSGETTGRLDEVLNYLADSQEKEYELLSRIKGALIYPAFLMVSMMGVGFTMMIYVIPQLISILQESGASLPIATRILIGTSDVLSQHTMLFFIGLIGLIGGMVYARTTPQGTRIWDIIKVRAPMMGPVFRHVYLVRFTRNLHTLLAGGVPLADALSATAEVLGNSAFKDVLDATVNEVRDGHPLTTIFQESSLFPSTVNQILTVGEQTGRLQEVLEKLTNFYTLELEAQVRILISLMEPLILVIMGVAVGIMVAAVILPMYQLASTI